MKRFVGLLLVLMVFTCGTAAAEHIDMTGISYEELAELVTRAHYEMMQSDEWEEVQVPIGLYLIGRDIPAGKWEVEVDGNLYGMSVIYFLGVKLNENKTELDAWDTKTSFITISPNSTGRAITTITLQTGYYFQVASYPCIFRHYSGTPFTFK